MSASCGFGLCGLLNSDLSFEQKQQFLFDFAKHGLTPVFYEIIDGRCLQATFQDGQVAIHEIEGPSADEIRAVWETGNGHISYDDWVALAEYDDEGLDLVVPGYQGNTKAVRLLTAEGDPIEKIVRSLEHTLECVEEDQDELEDPDYLLQALSTAKKYQFLFTISE